MGLLATNEEAIYVTDSIVEDKKLAEFYLLNYETELKKYELAKEEFINYQENTDENIGGGRSSITSNPTEKAVLLTEQFNKRYEGYRWLKAVEIVQRGLGERKNIFIKARRDAEKNSMYSTSKGRKGWVIFVQHRYADLMEKRFIIPGALASENTIKGWWKDIVNQTIFVSNKILCGKIMNKE